MLSTLRLLCRRKVDVRSSLSKVSTVRQVSSTSGRHVSSTSGRHVSSTNQDKQGVAAGSQTMALDSQDPLPSLVNVAQGPKTSIFSQHEMESRVNKLRQHMVQENIDACLFTSYHNICYYAQFVYLSMGRQYGLVVDHNTQTTITSKVDWGQPSRKVFGENLTYTDWQRDNYYKAVQKLAGTSKHVGVEFDHMSLDTFTKLKQALPQATFVDVGIPCMQMRMIKSPEEIEITKDGASIADMAAKAATGAMVENVPEYEVAMTSTRKMTREIAKQYPTSDIMDIWTWFQTGPYNSDGAHNPVTSRRLQKGDICVFNCFPMINGHYSALERTLFFDHASDAHLKYWQMNVDVHERGLELIKPGARCSDIAKELNVMVDSQGLMPNRSFGYGHSFGVISSYYGREAGLEIREDVDTILEPGMIISMEPHITIPAGQPGEGGYREHDILVVHETGAENITKFPFGPEHNIIKSR